MASESWVHYHQQRIEADLREGAHRADLARQATAGGASRRPTVATRLAALTAWFGGSPAAGAGYSASSQQLPR